MKTRIIIAVAIGWALLAGTIAGAQTYPNIYGPYKAAYEDQKDLSYQEHVLSGKSTFRFYVPPAATQVQAWVYCPPGAVMGAAIRSGSAPVCGAQYNEAAGLGYNNFVQCLPWQAGTPPLSQTRTQDWAMYKSSEGQIVLLSGSVSSAGEWVYVRVFGPYVDARQVKIVISVNQPAYREWFDGLSGDPSGNTWPGGTCDFTKIEGCDYPDDSQPPNDSTSLPGQTDWFMIKCVLEGGTWESGTCAKDDPVPVTYSAVPWREIEPYDIAVAGTFEPVVTFNEPPGQADFYALLYNPEFDPPAWVARSRLNEGEIVFVSADLAPYRSAELGEECPVEVFKSLAMDVLSGWYLYWLAVPDGEVKRAMGVAWKIQ